ncbi:MAG TPA: SCO family protein [Candidatus Sulfotelmatobacter sp.]|nr:SCO family protein [Candidatus Sulfotelmatobacter sp.]
MVAALALLLATASPFVPEERIGDAVPDIPLVAQDGRPFSLARGAGRVQVVTFVYTRCGDERACPAASGKFAWLQRHLGAAPIRLVEITLDPAYDTPAVLRRYGRAFGEDPARWTLVTGRPDDVADLATRLGIATRRTAPLTIVHTEAAIVIAPDGTIAERVAGADWDPLDVLALARARAEQRIAPLTALRLWLAAAAATCGAASAGLSGAAMLGVLALTTALVAAVFVRALRAR